MQLRTSSIVQKIKAARDEDATKPIPNGVARSHPLLLTKAVTELCSGLDSWVTNRVERMVSIKMSTFLRNDENDLLVRRRET